SAPRLPAAPVPRRGQVTPGDRHRLHRRPPPLGCRRRAPGLALRRIERLPRRGVAPGRPQARAPMIDHMGFEVTDLARSARFYDALLFALGARRMFESEHAVAYGINGPLLWIVVRGRPAAPGYGH